MPTEAHPAVSILIPTWNGLSLLRDYLPSVLQAAAAYPGECEFLVIDDGGNDETPAFLAREYPAVRLIRRARNEGFAAAVNEGIAATAHPLVLLLNNDIRVAPDFILPLAEQFARAAEAETGAPLFAAVSLQINPAADDRVNPAYDGYRLLRFVRGELRFVAQPIDPHAGEGPRPTSLANGGCTLFSRDRIRELGGLCGIFNPAYYEDAELSVRALQRGWRIVFEPRSVVWHRPNSTTAHATSITVLVMRNAFYFQWMMLDSASLWIAHLAWLPVRLLQRRFTYIRGLLQALRGLPKLTRQRRLRGRPSVRALAAVLADYSSRD